MDRKVKKVITINKELHSRGDVERLYISRMKRQRGLVGCKVCVKAQENSLE